MSVDSRSMTTRFQLTGPLNEADFEMYRRKLPLTPEARINGTFDIEVGRCHSPKGLLEGKYLFYTEPEFNQWPDGTTFWRSGAVGIFKHGDIHIIDYDMFNISTLFAAESILRIPGGALPMNGHTDLTRESNVKKIVEERIMIEVIEQFESERYPDYWPVEYQQIQRDDFLVGFEEGIQTSTFIEFEERLLTGKALS